MIEPPPRCFIAGAAILVPSQTPFWLTLMMASHSSSLVSSVGVDVKTELEKIREQIQNVE